MCGNKSFFLDCIIVILVDVGFFGADFFDDELSPFTFSSNDFCVLDILLMRNIDIIKPLTEKVKGFEKLLWWM